MPATPSPLVTPKRGYILLDALLGIGLFALVVVGLAKALTEITGLVQTARIETRVMRQLESTLVEASKTSQIREGNSTSEDQTLGITYETRITPLKLQNQAEEKLDQLFHVEVIARWEHRGDKEQRILDTYRYAPLYREGGGRGSLLP